MTGENRSRILSKLYKSMDGLLRNSSFYESDFWFKNDIFYGESKNPKQDTLIIKALRLKESDNKIIADLNITLLNNNHDRAVLQAREIDLIFLDAYHDEIYYSPVWYEKENDFDLRYIDRRSIYPGFRCIYLFYTAELN